MEEQVKNRQDCGCGGDCCKPGKKGNLLSKIVFIAILLAVAAIITIKLNGVSNAGHPDVLDTLSIKQTSLIDTTGAKECDKPCSPSEGSSCCNKTRK